jgi:hypothetical protein
MFSFSTFSFTRWMPVRCHGYFFLSQVNIIFESKHHCNSRLAYRCFKKYHIMRDVSFLAHQEIEQLEIHGGKDSHNEGFTYIQNITLSTSNC